MKEPNEPNYAFSVPNVPGESSGRNGSCPSGRGAYLQHLVAPPKVAGDRGGQFVDLVKHADDVMNSRVRGVDEDSVSQPQLAEAVKPLHCWGVYDFELSRREFLVAV
jgi:hypothetical protein